MNKAILFDFDYTLVDSSRGIVKCFNNVLNELELPLCDEKEIMNSIGEPLETTFKRLCPNINVTYEVFYSLFMKHSKKIMLDYTYIYDDTKSTLQQLYTCGYKIGIVSSKDNSTIKKIAKAFDFEKFVDIIVGEDDVLHPKPHPEGINYTIRKIDASTDNVIYVGDSIIDAYAAINAGVQFLPVLSGTSKLRDFDKIGIKKNFSKKLSDILKYI